LRRTLPFAIFPAIMTERIAITVNGEARDIAPGQTLAALLAAIGLDTRKVAVERNEEIVPRSTYGAVALLPGDRLEIVHFIGGG
jgi:thiazole synthase/sulfur carrier protein